MCRRANPSPTLLRVRGVRWWNAAFSPDGQLLTLGGSNGAIELWDVSRGAQHVAMISASAHEELQMMMMMKWGSCVVLFPRWPTAGFGGDNWNDFAWLSCGTCRAGSMSTRLMIDGIGGSVTSVVFSPDGRLLAYWNAGDGRIKLWDVSRREHVATISAHEEGGL